MRNAYATTRFCSALFRKAARRVRAGAVEVPEMPQRRQASAVSCMLLWVKQRLRPLVEIIAYLGPQVVAPRRVRPQPRTQSDEGLPWAPLLATAPASKTMLPGPAT